MLSRCLPVLILIVSELTAKPAAAPWAPVRAVDGGGVSRIALDGTRICAATFDGIYCRESDAASWRLAYLEGKDVADLVRTRKGWVAVARDSSSEDPAGYVTRGYVSRDNGSSWRQVEIPAVGNASFLLQASGDTVVYPDGDGFEGVFFSLSVDGGETWKLVSSAGYQGRIHACAPLAGAFLCLSSSQILKVSGPENAVKWERVDTANLSCHLHYSSGRAYVMDSLGVLSVYGPGGLERRLPSLPNFGLSLVSDSLILADSGTVVAFVRGNGTAWTRIRPPNAHRGYRQPGGIWTGGGGVVVSFLSSPEKARLEGSQVSFEPYAQGLRSRTVRFLSAAGRSLLATSGNAFWKRSPDGGWTSKTLPGIGITGFFSEPGLAMLTIEPGNREDPPTLMSTDSGATWQVPPPSLPGTVVGLVRMGGLYLAHVHQVLLRPVDSVQEIKRSLYEARSALGPWTLRRDLGDEVNTGLSTCGARLFAEGFGGKFASSDTGKTWTLIPGLQSLPVDGIRTYASNDTGDLWESGNCGDQWTQVPVPWGQEADFVGYHTGGRQPLVAVSTYRGANYFWSARTRIYPLPGASSEWSGIEEHVLPGALLSLLLHEGVLYASVLGKGLYAMEATPSTLHPGAHSRKAPRHRFRGWYRIDGRAVPAGAFPGGTPSAQTPLFRPGFAK